MGAANLQLPNLQLDVAHMLAGGLVLVSFLLLYQNPYGPAEGVRAIR
jgi:hypothetical protein